MWDSIRPSRNMKDANSNEMLPEYNFSIAEQGKYAKHFPHGVKTVLLDDDVAKVFFDTKQINDIQRALIPTIKKRSPRKGTVHSKP